MIITKLQVSNFMKVKLLEIKPNVNAVVISGKNGSGKSSVLNSFFAALQNAEAAKVIEHPIRHGESKASVTVELGDLIVTRTWTESGTYLKVESKDGASYKSPQTMLDKLVGKLSFDPLEFAGLSEKEQLRVLMDLVPLPKKPEDFEAEKKALFDERTEVNRDLKSAQARLSGFPSLPENLPDTEVSASSLLDKIREADHNNAERLRADAKRTELLRKSSDNARRLKEYREQLAQLEQEQEEITESIAQATSDLKGKQHIDTSGFSKQLAELEQTNRLVRSARDKKQREDEAAELFRKSEALTAQLDALDQEKRAMLAAAPMPVKGLSFDESGIYFNDVPFSQCSASERLRVSLGILIKLNPKLKVVRFMNDSFHLLDSDNKRVVMDVLGKFGFQCWIESVADEAEESGFMIEDGSVRQEQVFDHANHILQPAQTAFGERTGD